MARFSIVVPAYKVQAYLHECLESVLSQSFTDFELIVVDDCSPDFCGEIVDEFADRDSRVVAVHLPENVGLGRARNAGLARASGDYVLFLDGDDTMVPGSLEAVAGRLKETADPDILVFDYARIYWNGLTLRNERADLVSQHEPGVFPLRDRPALLRLLSVVWNKAYRREFVAATGLTFQPGYYEDVPWTYPMLFTAKRIACLDRVCVHYRQRRQGAITSTPGHGHFDVFEQYDRAFAYLDAHPELDAPRALFFTRMVDHIWAVLTKPQRLPRGARGRFLQVGAAHYRRHEPAGYIPPKGPWALRHLLLRSGSPALYQGLWHARAVHQRLRTWIRQPASRFSVLAPGAHYRLQRLLPVDPHLAVFGACRNGGYAGSPAAIEAKVRELVPGMHTAWVAGPEHDHTLPGGVERLTPGSMRFWTVMARAKFFVSDSDFPHGVAKRPGTVHVQTHRGTPLKRMGVHLMDYPAGDGGTDFDRLLERCDRWDFSLSANRHSTLTWERAYPSGHTALEYGSPCNDVLYTATAEDVRRLRTMLGIPEDCAAVLYAPTPREYVRGFQPRFDLARVSEALGPRFLLLVRAPSSGGASPELRRLHAAGTVLDVSEHPSVEELCLACDALITDYSSIMFDYANLDRPIVVHADDWDVYRAVRGLYVDILTEGPGVITRTDEELIEAFTSGEWRGERAERLRADFRRRFCPFDDGRAAERVVRHVFLGEREALPGITPLDERTPAPAVTSLAEPTALDCPA